MIRIWDGFLSLIAALITAGVVGVPLWGAFLAVRAEMIPLWAWVPMIALAGVGLLMFGAFARKASRGVHPLRERRR
ncbi:MAG: hypothetical protein OXQ92_07135 [Boseongicola sp.]|nr:hypothetical protein [Boseongicola sp.]MDD9976713.1 hypothetical protein [Boseongicola sp.]